MRKAGYLAEASFGPDPSTAPLHGCAQNEGSFPFNASDRPPSS
jgi:hypothetical protein